MTKKNKCKKWNHNFSYNGKKSCQDVKCRFCGTRMTDWVDERKKEFELKLYGAIARVAV